MLLFKPPILLFEKARPARAFFSCAALLHTLEEDLLRKSNRMSVQSGIRSNRTALAELHSLSPAESRTTLTGAARVG